MRPSSIDLPAFDNSKPGMPENAADTALKALLVQARNLPDQPGVYRFLNKNGYPLYIGKSINIKQRVLSHLYATKRCAKERKLAQSSHSVVAHTTPGELSALLLESKLIKQEQPLFNRRLRRTKTLMSWHFQVTEEEYLSPTLIKAQWPPKQQGHYLGLYTNRTRANQQLMKLADDNLLCKKKLNLEKTVRACFGYQLKKCKGACIGLESAQQFNQRLTKAVTHEWLEPWPFSGAVSLIEDSDPDTCHIVHEWFYLGSIKAGAKFKLPPLDEQNQMLLDRDDDYRILLKWLLKPSESITIEPYSLDHLRVDSAAIKN